MPEAVDLAKAGLWTGIMRRGEPGVNEYANQELLREAHLEPVKAPHLGDGERVEFHSPRIGNVVVLGTSQRFATEQQAPGGSQDVSQLRHDGQKVRTVMKRLKEKNRVVELVRPRIAPEFALECAQRHAKEISLLPDVAAERLRDIHRIHIDPKACQRQGNGSEPGSILQTPVTGLEPTVFEHHSGGQNMIGGFDNSLRITTDEITRRPNRVHSGKLCFTLIDLSRIRTLDTAQR